MKITLKKYFKEKCNNNSELIGLKVVTYENDSFYINDFDQMTYDTLLPTSVFVSKKQGSNYGKYIESDKLYIDVDTWEPMKK